MFERILVPLDGSATSEAVLPHLRRLIKGGDSEVILVRSENPLAIEGYGRVADVVLAGAREYLMGIQSQLPRGVQSQVIERLGTPLQTILRVADEEQATLIAMATHGRRGVRRFFLGSVAEQVIHRSSIPIFAVHPSWSYELTPPVRLEDLPFQKILLPLYGGGRWNLGAWVVRECSRRFGSQILILPLWDTFSSQASLGRSEVMDQEGAKRELDEVMTWMAKEGVPSVPLFEEGDPFDQILRVCPSRQVDLVVMSAMGRGEPSPSIAGGLEERLLRESTTPILAIRGHPEPRGSRELRLREGRVAR